jgi:cystathionine beta-lyase/cystathionine gamma-synthase
VESRPAYAFETWTIHAGEDPNDPTGALVPPIYPTVGFSRPSLDQPREFTYSRRSNPTRAALERVLARLHGGQHAVAFGSGMAAISAVGQLLKAGSHVVLPDDVYGNTHRLYTLILPEQDIRVDFVDYTDLAAVERAVRPETRMLWVETPTNPTQNIVDLTAVSEIGHRHGVRVAVDNSWLSPYFQQPLAFGVDLVVESTTKYLNGHDDVMGGAVVTNDPALGERLAFLQYVGGAVPSPFDCWLLLRGLKTLAVRMDRHQSNALAVARFLGQHPNVECVHYPGLPQHPGYAIAQRQMRGGGGMVSFEVRGDRDAARRVAEATRLFKLAAGFGGVESLIAHPLTMTHASQAGLDIAPGARLLRLSVGIEAEADLLADLGRALDSASPSYPAGQGGSAA